MTEGERTVKAAFDRGFALGVLQAHRKVLVRQLRGRFRRVPKATVARIEAADLAQLQRWLDKILTATTLEDAIAEG